MSELNFIWPAIWQELTNHAAVILSTVLYFQKSKRLRLTFLLTTLYSLSPPWKRAKCSPKQSCSRTPLQVCNFTAHTHPPRKFLATPLNCYTDNYNNQYSSQLLCTHYQCDTWEIHHLYTFEVWETILSQYSNEERQILYTLEGLTTEICHALPG